MTDDELIMMILVDSIPARGKPLKNDLIQLAYEYGIKSVPKKWTRNMIAKEIKTVLEKQMNELESKKPSIKSKFKSKPKSDVLECNIDENQHLRVFRGKEEVDVSNLTHDQPCFRDLPSCETSCKDVIDRKNYPCTLNYTVFPNREEFLEYKDLHVKGEYARRERLERAQQANKELENEIKKPKARSPRLRWKK